jgi:RNA polymerase sigma-70 factor (ECF subfamily)
MANGPHLSANGDDLVIRARSSRDAFAGLFDEYYPRILRYCCARLASRAAAEDATSETFLQIARHLPTFPGSTDGDFRRWAFRIAGNAVNQQLRRHQKRRETDAIDVGTIDCATDEVDRRLDWPRVSAAMRRLDDRDQALIALRFFAQLAHEDIADVLELTTSAVRTALSRALTQLRTQLGSEDFVEASWPRPWNRSST